MLQKLDCVCDRTRQGVIYTRIYISGIYGNLELLSQFSLLSVSRFFVIRYSGDDLLCSLSLLLICRLEAFNLRCSLTNIDVLECVETDEVYEDTTCLESNCSVPAVHLKSDTLETEALNLLVGGTYVDSILTALPVSFCLIHVSPYLSILASLILQ